MVNPKKDLSHLKTMLKDFPPDRNFRAMLFRLIVHFCNVHKVSPETLAELLEKEA